MRTSNPHRGLTIWSAAAFSLALLTTFSYSAPVLAEVSFEGERIVWIVPGREGGGSDNFTRAIAPHLARHLPGKPKIVIRNIPGNGTIPGTNQFVEQAKDDGLMIITNSTSATMNQILKTDAVRYDLSTFKYVLAAPQGTFAYAHPSTGVKSSDDFKMLTDQSKSYRFGGFGPTSAELRLMVSWELLGVNIKPLWGLSRGKVRQAFMRGETELNYDTASSWFRKVLPLVKANEAIGLYTFGIQNAAGEYIRDPVAPELPHFNELYAKVHGKPLAGAERDAWKALFFVGVMASKSISLPENVKPEVLAAYRKAAMDMVADPKFAKAKDTSIGPYPVSIGDDAAKVLDNAVNISADARAWLKNFLKTKHDVEVKL